MSMPPKRQLQFNNSDDSAAGSDSERALLQLTPRGQQIANSFAAGQGGAPTDAPVEAAIEAGGKLPFWSRCVICLLRARQSNKVKFCIECAPDVNCADKQARSSKVAGRIVSRGC